MAHPDAGDGQGCADPVLGHVSAPRPLGVAVVGFGWMARVRPGPIGDTVRTAITLRAMAGSAACGSGVALPAH